MPKPTSPDVCKIIHRLRAKKVEGKVRSMETIADEVGLHVNTVRFLLRGKDPSTGLPLNGRKCGRPRIKDLDGDQVFKQVFENQRDLTVTEVAAAVSQAGK